MTAIVAVALGLLAVAMVLAPNRIWARLVRLPAGAGQNTVSAQTFEETTTFLLKRPLKQLYALTADKRLIGILAAMGILIDAKPGLTIPDRSQSLEAYTTGKYEECIDISNRVLSKDPLDIAIRVIFCKAAVAIEKRPPNTGGVCGDLHDSLFNLLSANDQFFRSAYALLQISDRFFDHNWAQYLRVAVWHELGPEEQKSAQSWTRDMYVRDSGAFCSCNSLAKSVT